MSNLGLSDLFALISQKWCMSWPKFIWNTIIVGDIWSLSWPWMTFKGQIKVLFVYWSSTSPFVTVMDISATDRNPEPGDNPLLFSTDSKGSFRCTQPQDSYAHHQAFVNQLGTTGICPHRSNQPTQDSNPGPSDHNRVRTGQIKVIEFLMGWIFWKVHVMTQVSMKYI